MPKKNKPDNEKVIPLNMKRKKIFFNTKGMTLIELLVTIALVVITTSILVAILKEGFVSYDHTLNEADSQLTLRHQANVILEDIRSSKIAAIDEVHYPYATSSLYLFTGNKNEQKTITYSLIEMNGKTNLVRQESNAEQKVAIEGVEYFNPSVNPENNLVTIKIKLKVPSLYQNSSTKEIVLQAKPRAALSN